MTTKRTVTLMLLDNVYNLGIVGDVVEVKAGYARNYLLPMNLATPPTEQARKAVETRRAEVERQLREERDRREALIQKLEGFELTLQRAANKQGVLFGSVTQSDIAESLDTEGFPGVNPRNVRIGEPLKHLDSYMIPIQLDEDLRTEIKVWVVSDRPLEEEEEAEGEPTGEPGETIVEDADAELIEQPPADLPGRVE